MKAVIKSDWNLQPKHKHNLLYTTKQTPQNRARSFRFLFSWKNEENLPESLLSRPTCLVAHPIRKANWLRTVGLRKKMLLRL